MVYFDSPSGYNKRDNDDCFLQESNVDYSNNKTYFIIILCVLLQCLHVQHHQN